MMKTQFFKFFKSRDDSPKKPIFHSLSNEEVRSIVEKACGDYKDSPENAFSKICEALGGTDKLNQMFQCKGYDDEYFTLFHALEYADRSDYRILDKFIKAGLNINLQDGDGNTPLLFHIACGNHNEALKLMPVLHNNRFTCPPDFDLRGYAADTSSDGEDYGNTALTLILAKGYERQSYHSSVGKMTDQKYDESNNYLVVAQQLLEYGANVNVPRRDGITPLHIAYLRHDKKAADLLLKHGADVDAVDNFGRKTADYLNMSHSEACDILKQITQGFYLLTDQKEYEQTRENMREYIRGQVHT